METVMYQRQGKTIAIYVMQFSFTPGSSITDAMVTRIQRQENTLQWNGKICSLISQTLVQS